MKIDHLYEDYALISFTPKQLKEILEVPPIVFGSYLTPKEWHELVKDLCLLTRSKDTLYVLGFASMPSIRRSEKIKLIERYILIQKIEGESSE